jgi:beta-lactamase regulating signal transducer with metallopeptidase domain/predicted metallopeptidase
MIISPDNLQQFADLALKSIIIMLGALLLARLCRRAPAAIRHLTWTLALCGLLALPLLSLLLPGWNAPLLPALSRSESIGESSEEFKPVSGVATEEVSFASLPIEQPDSPTAVPAVAERIAAPVIDWAQLALIVWLAGAMIVLARLATGMFRVRRVVRLSQFVIDYHWGALLRRLAGQLNLPEHIALLKSQYIGMPQTWGVWHRVVLLPEDAENWSEEWRRIVLLHELAHIKRRDCLTQLLAQLVCAIYWFNPLVWVAARRLRVEREIACDDYVLQAGTRASDYAKYLLAYAGLMKSNETPAGLPSPAAAGIACSQLELRVRSILDPAIKHKGLNRRARFIIVAVAACLLFPLAALQPWSGGSGAASPITSPIADQADQSSALPQAPQTDASTLAQPNKNKEPKGAGAADLTGDDQQIDTAVDLSEQADRDAQEDNKDNNNDNNNDELSTQEPDTSKSDSTSSGMTVESIIKLKIHGVTPEFIESLRRAGFANLSIEKLVKLRIHGISEEYIRETQKASAEKLSLEDLIQLRIFDVTPEYAKEMKDAGYNLPLKSLKKMRMFGVTPSYIETLRKHGYTNLTAEQLVKLKMHGVSESYLKEMRAAGFDKLSSEELVKLRIFGVTADYVKQMRAAGLKNVSLNDLIKMKMHGIDKILLKSDK